MPTVRGTGASTCLEGKGDSRDGIFFINSVSWNCHLFGSDHNQAAYGKRLNTIWILGGLVAFMVAGCAQDDDPLSAFEHGDYQTACQLWRPMAENGDVNAQNYLGMMYYLGLGVSRDYGKAVKWYTIAAMHGNANAQRNLGTMYHEGLGVPQDYLQAYAWYYASEKQGNRRAEIYIQSLTGKLTPNQQMKARALVQQYISHGG